MIPKPYVYVYSHNTIEIIIYKQIRDIEVLGFETPEMIKVINSISKTANSYTTIIHCHIENNITITS